MVKFAWPVKTKKYSSPPSERDTYPPPPPYREEEHHAPPLAFPSTTASAIPTTNTTTTTTPTTHFLSLPIWRRRQEQQVSPPQRLSMSDLRTYQTGLDHLREQGTPSSREKSLPPTPTSSSEDASGAHIRSTDSPPDDRSWSCRPSPQVLTSTTTPSPPARPSASSAKVALAQAALTIGLPHGMPQASASSSRSDVNSTAFVNIHQPPSRHPVPPASVRPSVRRAKSFQQLSRKFGRGDDRTPDAQRPRSRGIASDPVNAFDSDENGKGDALEDIPSHVTPPRTSLVRRASFWNRKRNDSLRSAGTPPSERPHKSFDHSSPSLPLLRPMSPLYFDANMSRSSPALPMEEPLPPLPPGLNSLIDSRNRHLPPHPSASSPDLLVQTSKKPSVGRRRPSTADPAAGRSRTQSYYSRPPDHSSPLASAPSQQLQADVATPRRDGRPRSQTNPPLLHRLSANLFSFGSSSLSPPTNGAPINHSPGASPRTSTSKPSPPKPRLNKESPAAYVDRLLDTISKADVASVLASSGETFYANGLQAYINRFEFDGDPLDVALRKLLMDVGLPRETQQIDRVMQTFANRYLACNQGLFISDDHPYILAFSLIMLHTDAFNKSNKRKMTKPDYIKNTQLPGIYPEVLDYYYDNIVFAPFIFVEDPLEANLQRSLDSGPSRLLSGFPPQHSLPGNGSTVNLLGKTNKIDPYYMIAKNLLSPLRVDVEEYISLETRYSYKDNSEVWNEEDTHKAFINAGAIEVSSAERRMSMFALNIGGFGAPYPSIQQPLGSTNSSHQISELRVVKAGLLNRKDTTLDIGKRAKSSKWRSWSVVLTSSQLLFFRDHTWATSLQEQMKHRDGRILVPPVSLLKPDEVLSLKDSVALHDRSYDKHCTFLFISGDNRPYLLQASVEEDMNNWVSCINYASAFKTIGVPIRDPGMSGKDVELMGIAAAASHLRDLHCASSDSRTPRIHAWCRNSDDFIDRLSSSSSTPYAISRSGRLQIVNGREDMDLDVSAAPNSVGMHQLKTTFHQVKADLAAGRWSSTDVSTVRPDGRPRAHSLESVVQPLPASFPEDLEQERASTRTRDIQSKLAELDSKISSLQLQEESDLRLLRHIAILTPFQRATRERLRIVVLQTSKGVQKTRLELEMRLCHREVLSNDLIAQEREWHRTKKIALKAATDTLQSRREPSIPRIAPLRVDQPIADSSDKLRHLPESSYSTAGSFQTALDFDSPVSAMGEQLDSPVTSVRGGTPTGSPRPFSPAQTNDGTTTPETRPSHERFDTAQEEPDEEAEEWNKTRAAKRVSLVRMPSTLNVPHVRLGCVSGTDSVWVTPRSPRSMPEP